MGRPRTPIEKQITLSKGDGRTPSKTAVAVQSYTHHSGAPVTPFDLKDRGVTEWEKVWDAGFWLKPDQDYHWVEMIARAYDDIDIFRQAVREEGLTVRGYNGQTVAHPLIAEIRKAEALIQKCLQVLGFSPTDRAKLGIAEAKARMAGHNLQEMIQGARR